MTPAPAGLRPRLARHAARARLRRVPGAGDAHRAPQHRPLLGRPGRGPDHGPHRGRREPAHGLLPRHPGRGDQARAVGGGPRDRRRGPRASRCRAPASRASCARRPQIAKAGIYDLRVHRDEVLLPILRHWRIFELTGLDAAAEAARERLAEHLASLDEAAKRFEERLAANGVAPGGAPADCPAESPPRARPRHPSRVTERRRHPADACPARGRDPRRPSAVRPTAAAVARPSSRCPTTTTRKAGESIEAFLDGPTVVVAERASDPASSDRVRLRSSNGRGPSP